MRHFPFDIACRKICTKIYINIFIIFICLCSIQFSTFLYLLALTFVYIYVSVYQLLLFFYAIAFVRYNTFVFHFLVAKLCMPLCRPVCSRSRLTMKQAFFKQKYVMFEGYGYNDNISNAGWYAQTHTQPHSYACCLCSNF